MCRSLASALETVLWKEVEKCAKIRAMKQPQTTFFMGAIGFLKRTGYALVASSLILLMFISLAHLGGRLALLYSYALFVVGIALVAISKSLEIIQYYRLRSTARLLSPVWLVWWRPRLVPL